MNKKTQSKLVTAAKEVLATFCWKDEKGYFYEEIYADYRDELDDGSLKKICEAEHPQEHFLDWLDEAYLYSRWDCENAVIKRVLEDETVAKIVKRLDGTEVYEIIRDLFYVKLPEKHFLRHDVLVDIMVDTGDANYDYTLNTFNPHYDSCNNSINESVDFMIRGTVPAVYWRLCWIKMSACRSAVLKVQNTTAAEDIPSGAFTVAVPASGKKL